MKKIAMFVVAHKDINIDLYPDRYIIFVGKNKEALKEKYQDDSRVFFDDEGDNIANLNYTYCEMTALYWIWKNYHDAEYISIEHYRRLHNDLFGRPRRATFLLNKLKKYDIVTAINWLWTGVNRFMFIHAHGKDNYLAMREGIKRIAPLYLEAFDKRMKRGQISYFNMICTSKENFDKYMEYVWPILESIRKEIQIPTSGYNSRMMGFIAERLLSPYIDKNKLKRYGSLVYKMNKKYSLK